MGVSDCNPYADFAAKRPIFGSLRENNEIFEDSSVSAAKRCTPFCKSRCLSRASLQAPSRSATVVSL
jgi:hypothetical protein